MQDCFYSLQGWWSYELCLGRQLRQFHLEEGTNRPNLVIDLGHYDHAEASPSDHAPQDTQALWQHNTHRRAAWSPRCTARRRRPRPRESSSQQSAPHDLHNVLTTH